MTADLTPDHPQNPSAAANTAVHDASSVIVARPDPSGDWQILMGQRGAAAVFMPSKYVFPGGRVEPEDRAPLPLPLHEDCQRRLAQSGDPQQLVGSALRELAEETGLRFAPEALEAQPLRYVFRAITPPGRPRRFDARFFLADASALMGDPDDFSGAEDELSHLHWIGLEAARALDLPFVTEVVLAEVSNLLRGGLQPGVPFFDNSGPEPQFRRIR